MNLTDETASVLLTADGEAILTMAQVPSNGSNTFQATIAESDDLGLWIRVRRKQGPHLLMLRWDYILTLEVRERGTGHLQFRAVSEAR